MKQETNINKIETTINKNGEVLESKNNVVIMSIEEYKKKMLEDDIEKKLLKAEKQIEEGKTIKAAEVFKELEELYEF